MKRIFLFCCLQAVLLASLCAQGETRLYLFNLIKSPDGNYSVFGAKYLSGFNPKGYTNQPFFTANGDILVSVRKFTDTQNDIWLLSPATKKCRQLTRTKANEYSPQLHTGTTAYTAVQQIEGEPIHQQVIRFSATGNEYETLTPGIMDVGYYASLNAEQLMLYLVDGEAGKLSLYGLSDHATKRVTTSIGRTLIPDGKGSVYYIHKFSDAYWYIKKYNESATVIEIVAETPSKSEDFAMAPDGTFFMGKDHKLMFLDADRTTWKECADLVMFGIKHITRMAISADGKQLALVATPE